eukprot:gene42674-52140_t
MEEWDDVVMLEQRIYEQACQEGVKSGHDVPEARYEGLSAGMLKGSAIGFELGFYSVAIQDAQERAISAQSRPRKLLSDLEQKLSGFPRTNAPDVDFDKEVQSMRALYRGSGSRLGKFPPNIGDSATGEDAKSGEVSW